MDDNTNLAVKFQRYDSLYAYFRHLSTLSTGSIIIIAAFLEKVFTEPAWIFLVKISISGFLLSVVCSVIAYTLLIGSADAVETPPGLADGVGVAALLLTWLGFLVGISTLAVFAIKNIG